jgi:hypothetical protein
MGSGFAVRSRSCVAKTERTCVFGLQAYCHDCAVVQPRRRVRAVVVGRTNRHASGIASCLGAESNCHSPHQRVYLSYCVMISKTRRRAMRPWAAAEFCARLSLITSCQNLWLSFRNGSD